MAEILLKDVFIKFSRGPRIGQFFEERGEYKPSEAIERLRRDYRLDFPLQETEEAAVTIILSDHDNGVVSLSVFDRMAADRAFLELELPLSRHLGPLWGKYLHEKRNGYGVLLSAEDARAQDLDSANVHDILAERLQKILLGKGFVSKRKDEQLYFERAILGLVQAQAHL